MDALDIDISLARRAFAVQAALTVGDETVALVGPSGAGKSSLLRAVAGLERPQAGHIALGGERWFDAASRTHLRPERRRVGFLPQEYALFPHLSVAGNIRFAGRRPRPDLLERFGIGHLARARPNELSGGERQRVGLARALARDPRVLLLDEPFAALDAITRVAIRDELGDELRKLGLPTLLVTHAFEDATALAARVGVIDRGRLLQLATPAELLRAPADATVAALTGANVLDGTATSGATGGSTVELAGGGRLRSATAADGPVRVAVHPWQLALSDPESSSLTDRVISVRHDRGMLTIRFARFTVRVEAGERPPIEEGERVGLRAAPTDVLVLAA
jgi:ABC-type sulfate/molybdate transport systems ATPase subunit